MIIGTTTEEFTIFAAGDSVYLRDHAKGLATSCALVNNNVHIHVTNPSEKDIKYLDFLGEGYRVLCPNGIYTSSYDTIDISKYNKSEKKTFYACDRFIVAPEIVKGNVLIVDMDCYLMDHINDLDSEVGIYLREHLVEKEWDGLIAKCAAGAVYCNRNSFDFLDYIKEFIYQNPMKLGVDQVAVYKAYLNFPNKNYTRFDSTFMDWDFKAGSKIWTGKGTRKMWNAAYTKKHNDIKRKFPIREEDYFNEKSSTTGT